MPAEKRRWPIPCARVVGGLGRAPLSKPYVPTVNAHDCSMPCTLLFCVLCRMYSSVDTDNRSDLTEYPTIKLFSPPAAPRRPRTSTCDFRPSLTLSPDSRCGDHTHNIRPVSQERNEEPATQDVLYSGLVQITSIQLQLELPTLDLSRNLSPRSTVPVFCSAVAQRQGVGKVIIAGDSRQRTRPCWRNSLSTPPCLPFAPSAPSARSSLSHSIRVRKLLLDDTCRSCLVTSHHEQHHAVLPLQRFHPFLQADNCSMVSCSTICL
jgi:hypothetical protein